MRGIYRPDSRASQQKGGRVFSWIDTIQKKPQGMEISLRQNRALKVDDLPGWRTPNAACLALTSVFHETAGIF
jgi:hypothetical protein